MSQAKCFKCGKRFDNQGLLLSFCLPCKVQILKNLTPAKLSKISKRLSQLSPQCRSINLKKWLEENAAV
jgi:endogenous inhibitor of DNA gyrase (YacG/DUF329 family)